MIKIKDVEMSLEHLKALTVFKSILSLHFLGMDIQPGLSALHNPSSLLYFKNFTSFLSISFAKNSMDQVPNTVFSCFALQELAIIQSLGDIAIKDDTACQSPRPHLLTQPLDQAPKAHPGITHIFKEA